VLLGSYQRFIHLVTELSFPL